MRPGDAHGVQRSCVVTGNREAAHQGDACNRIRRGSVLIVAPLGPLRDGLCALLNSMPNTQIVGVVAHIEAAVQAISECRPALVLLDSALPGEGFLPLLEHLKASWPRLQCLVLVDGVEQQGQAQIAEADAVLVKGAAAARLSAAVEMLLTQERQAQGGTMAADGVGALGVASQPLLVDALAGEDNMEAENA
jgi:DNA-binding response OmpR family regulator